ncbi:MAG TPA: NAD(P)-binding domain-containing protein [Candidatus Limnocylindrales bacterium]|nr:NAD(P)-binding domain-containing protein [Candidatus Limnocylindrales bacterium]
MADLNAAASPHTANERPSPPGSYPVVVVGSGPGALQLSYSLGRLGVRHAVVSADDSPGGMFRRWPFFQRLLSWTKPYAPVERGTRAYERYDWNSLLGDEPETRAIAATLMDGTSYFPSRPEMERNLATFAERARIPVRYGCRWTGTRTEAGQDGDHFVVETTDGEYRCGIAVFAVGVAQPYVPATPGFEHAAGYADTRAAETYAGKRIFIAGKQNSGFELASGLLPWARQIVLASPSPARLSVNTRSLVGIRARYVQPYEDHVLGGGVSILDASIDRIDPVDDGFRVRLLRTDGGPDLDVVVDEVIAATGFVAPLQDLPKLGVATFGQSRLPGQTPFWESATVPGIHFAGTIGQGAGGLKKHGIPSNSGAVHGARYNARVLARHISRRFGAAPNAGAIPPDAIVDRLVRELNESPELWHQKAYLAWVASAAPEGGFHDEGIRPLAHVLDAPGPDAVVLTLEADGSGAIYPVVYLRRDGLTEERVLEPHPFLDFGGPDHRAALADAVRSLGMAVVS